MHEMFVGRSGGYPAAKSIPHGSRAGGHLHWQLYVRFLVMFTTLKYMVVKLNSLCVCSVGGWSLYMDPLHWHLKVQYTSKLEPRCTVFPALDHMVQDFSPMQSCTVSTVTAMRIDHVWGIVAELPQNCLLICMFLTWPQGLLPYHQDITSRHHINPYSLLIELLKLYPSS